MFLLIIIVIISAKKKFEKVACHPFTLPVLGEVLVDVEIDGTIVIEITRGPFSDFAVSGPTDAQL